MAAGVVLIACTAAWALAAYPLRHAAGWPADTPAVSGWAMIACGLPTVFVVAGLAAMRDAPAEYRAAAALAGVGLRMFGALLLAALAVKGLRGAVPPGRVTAVTQSFWAWVLSFYGFTLVLEVTLVATTAGGRGKGRTE